MREALLIWAGAAAVFLLCGVGIWHEIAIWNECRSYHPLYYCYALLSR